MPTVTCVDGTLEFLASSIEQEKDINVQKLRDFSKVAIHKKMNI